MKDTSLFSLQSLSRPTVLAAIFGGLLVLCAIALTTNHILTFFSLEGLMVVGGGVITVAFMSFQASDVRLALRAVGDMFREAPTTHENLHQDVLNILVWARTVREQGLVGLESKVVKNHIDDSFVRYGLNMVISDYTPAEVRTMMETAAEAYDERACVPAHILQTMASHAPAFGMVGTLVGMVAMLCNLGTADTASIGPTLAVSFLSTLYGVLSARMVYMPAASRLSQKIDNIRFRNQLVTEGLVMLVANKSSIYIRDHLNSFLRPEIQESVDPILSRLQPQPTRLQPTAARLKTAGGK